VGLINPRHPPLSPGYTDVNYIMVKGRNQGDKKKRVHTCRFTLVGKYKLFSDTAWGQKCGSHGEESNKIPEECTPCICG
jgi:hypothetical protein